MGEIQPESMLWVERWWGHRGVIIHQSLTGSTAGPVESKSDTYQRCSLY